MLDLFAKTKKICQENNIIPQKKHGQNFLIDNDVYDIIIETAQLDKEDIVLEVGPGLGILTEKIAREVKKVITVEIDPVLCDFLPKRFDSLGLDNIHLICGDILNLAKNVKYNKIVANLPYNISAHFLYQYLQIRKIPELMVLMLQKEVVDRICAGSGKMSILAVAVQYFANPVLVKPVARQSFWPEPGVDSAIVKIIAKKNNRLSPEKEIDFFKLVKAGFSSRRKMLKNNLANIYKINPSDVESRLLKSDFDAKIRAQDLSVDDWKVLLGEF